MEKSRCLLKLLVPNMSVMVAKYSRGRLSHFEYPGLLDAPAMSAATVDLAADWTRSIAILSPLQADLPRAVLRLSSQPPGGRELSERESKVSLLLLSAGGR